MELGEKNGFGCEYSEKGFLVYAGIWDHDVKDNSVFSEDGGIERK